MRKLCFVLALYTFEASGFVLLSGPSEAKLPVSSTSPNSTFYWDGTSPGLENLNEVLGGRWVGLNDHDAMQQALVYALNAWNEVPGSFLRYQLIEEQGVNINSDDNKNVIVVRQDSNITTSAYSQPTIDGDVIRDCDVSISDKRTDALSLVYTLIHELGHCLGLGHSHTNYGAVMGYARGKTYLHLGADDMAGVIFLYPDPQYYDGKHRGFTACGRVGNLPQEAHDASKTFVALSFLFPFILALFLSRKDMR